MCFSQCTFFGHLPQIPNKKIDFEIDMKYCWSELSPTALVGDSCHVALHFLDREQVINLVGDDYNANTFSRTLESFWTEEKYETGPVRINVDGRVNNWDHLISILMLSQLLTSILMLCKHLTSIRMLSKQQWNWKWSENPNLPLLSQ